MPLPITARRDQKIYGHTIRVNLDKTLKPNLQLHVGAGYLAFHNPDSSPDEVLDFDAASEVGFLGSATTPAGFPVITGLGSNVAGGFNNSMGPGNANKYYNDKLTAVGNATYVRNQHMFKFGGEFKQEVWTDINKTYSQGQLFFNARQTGLPSTQGQNLGGGGIGLGYASFLLGIDRAGRRHRGSRSGVAEAGVELLRAGQLAGEPQAHVRLRPSLGLRRAGPRAVVPHQPGRPDDAESVGWRAPGRVHV